MGDIIKFPTEEYNKLERRDDYIEDFFSAVAWTASELNIDLDDHEEFGAIFSMMRDIVNKHLGLYYDSEGSGESATQV
jgi:hypothetical protein